MQSISLSTEEMDWVSGKPFYGPGAVYEGREVVQLKVLIGASRAAGLPGWCGSCRRKAR
jgi:hypothetical protein